MRNIAVLVAFMNAAVANIVSAQSQILTAHSGATDPSTEGFSISSFMGVGTGSPSANDLGLPAWVITCPDNVSTQFGYVSGGVSANQQAEIATQGFTLSVIARALQGYAPAFNASTPYITGSASVSPTNGVRYDIDFATDSGGNTLVVLPSIIVGADGSTCAAPSSNLTVTVPGNGWHTYQLVQSSSTGLADLYVDGVDVIQGYSGTYCPGGGTGYGLDFGDDNGGEIDFNLVQLITGHELALLTWTNPAAIAYGTPLSSTQLNASANVPGSFAYNPSSGAVLNPGTNTLSVTFTPTDTNDYPLLIDTVGLVVSPSQPVLNIQRAVYLTSSNLVVGSNYQIQASSDLINWTNQGSVFTATNSNWQSTNYWNVNDWNQLFFRLEVDP